MLYIIDLFCGAGGVTTGASMNDNVRVIACVNHDPLAIKSHFANHPECIHYIEDIKVLDLTDLINLVAKIRREDPSAVIAIWASLECTNHSIAKGGMSRDADSRTLGEHLIESEDEYGNLQPRYIPLLDPDIVFIENVKEFTNWGPLQIKVVTHIKNKEVYPYCPLELKRDKVTKEVTLTPVWIPIKELKGTDFEKWKSSIKELGYDYDSRILNSADYGAYTSRKRYFAQFTKPHITAAWPMQTHVDRKLIEKGKSPIENPIPWLPVKDILQLTEHGISIFGRTKKSGAIANLSDKTYERIYHGLIKFVAGGKKEFLVKYNSVNGMTGKYVPPSMDDPCPTVSTQGRMGIGSVQFINKYFSGAPESKSVSVEAPGPTVKCTDSSALMTAEFLATYHGTGHNCHSLEDPSPAIPTHDSVALLQAEQFVMNSFTSGGIHSDLENPGNSVLPVSKSNLVSAEPFIMDTQYGNNCKPIEEPSPTQTANRKHFYLINPMYLTQVSSVESPCFTLIARMDKAPPYIVMTEFGQPAILVEDGDSPFMIKIKEFMAMYGILDIKMRMFFTKELLRIQGFPEEYILHGTQADQKRFIGNAVEVNQAAVILGASADANVAMKLAV